VTDYLLPIADREPLGWIVAEQRTAFPAERANAAQKLRPGDRLLLYTTRLCFRNPTRDRGRLVGLAVVTKPSEPLNPPVRFGTREFPIGVCFRIELLAPQREGVELAPLVENLATFPDPRSWSARMRRALVPLATGDGDMLVRELRKVASAYPTALHTYRQAELGSM
jgi:hypothetical protein